jgi:flagellar biogenesis protein FliO
MQRIDLWTRHAACAGGVILMLFAAGAALAAEPAPALAQGRDIVELPSVGRVIVVFLIVAGMAVGAAFALRRYSPKFASGLSQTGSVRVIDRSSLNAGLRVHVIEIEGERIVVAENRSGVALLQLRRSPQNPDQGGST